MIIFNLLWLIAVEVRSIIVISIIINAYVVVLSIIEGTINAIVIVSWWWWTVNVNVITKIIIIVTTIMIITISKQYRL